MNIKKILAVVLSLIAVFSLAACQNDNKEDVLQESSSVNIGEDVGDVVSDQIPTSEVASVDTPEATDSSATEESSVPEDISENSSDDPADWSTEQIVEAYKNAAKKSNATAKSEQTIVLKSISVNNGEYEGLFEFITPIMSKLLANNSKEKDGITGGYNKLIASDVASAKAYKSGNNIAIEMVLREQTAGASEDANSGSVGHAITAVGDIGVVTKQLKDLGLPLEIPQESTKIYYTNPAVRVLINSNGEILNGTWRYTVDISLNNYKAFGKAVNTTSVVMDNTLTLNGGFSK